MPKPVLIGVGVAGAVVIIGGAALFMNMNNKPAANNDSPAATQTQSQPTVKDPNGDYKLFSDPSVTKHPEANVKFGNGQVLSFEYDGSKTNNDAYATLSYQLYYIDDSGSVQPIGGGNMEGKDGKGTFKTAEGDKVFNSSAKGKSGFFELQGTYGTTNVKLGMYPIKFDISE